jgi:hypothetical protein
MDSLLLTRQAFGQLFLGNERERERERERWESTLRVIILFNSKSNSIFYPCNKNLILTHTTHVCVCRVCVSLGMRWPFFFLF